MKAKKLIIFTLLAILVLSSFACGKGGGDEVSPTLSLDEARDLAADYVYRQFDDIPCADGKRVGNEFAAEWIQGIIYGTEGTWHEGGYWVLNPGYPSQFTVYDENLLVVPNGGAIDILNILKGWSYDACH